VTEPDGNARNGDGCDSSCAVEASSTCGDGFLDVGLGEECDDGATSNGDGCSSACQLEPVGALCGNGGSPDPLEKCDDGNTTNGDGCNPTCNLTGTVTTLATNVDASSFAVDDQYLWIGTSNCELAQLDIDACITGGSCNPVVVAGQGGCPGGGVNPSDGNGTNAVLSWVESIATDGTTVWFSNKRTLRAYDIATGDVTTLAGDPNKCAAINGNANTGLFFDMRGFVYDGGYLYMLEGCEEVLRRYDPATGNLTTIAGARQINPSVPQTGANQYNCPGGFSCVTGTPTDGYGLNAVFGSPRYMTSDHSGNLYITDTNGQSVRAYNKNTGYVSTFIGGAGYTDGAQSSVRVGRPRGMTSDGTSIYFNEQSDHTVRQILIDDANTSTLVGVRGCNGGADGQGGEGSQDWGGQCGAAAVSAMPRLDTPLGAIVYHHETRSIFLGESGRLRRIE